MLLTSVDRETVKAISRPMSDFIESGVLYTLNTQVMIPRGLFIGVYVDDDDPHTAIGWMCITYEEAKERGFTPDGGVISLREEAFERLVGLTRGV